MTNNNDHQDILAAIAHAAENCTPEPVTQPQAIAQPLPQQAPVQYAAPTANAAVTQLAQPSQVSYQMPAPQQQPAQAAQTSHGMPAAHAAFAPTSAQQQGTPNQEQGPSDEELNEVFAERKKKKFKLGLAVNITLLALLAAPCLGFGVWYQSSPANQAAFAELLDNFREVPNDVKKMATMTETYEEALAEVSAHGAAIDDATRALGVDPDQFAADEESKENDDAAFLKEQAQRTAHN